MYDKILKIAIEFEKRAQQSANPMSATTIPGGLGAYQDLLSGYKTWSKFTKGKNLIGVDVVSKQLIPENPTIQYIIKLMGAKSGTVNVALSVSPDGNVNFNVQGNHPSIQNIKNMLNKNIAPLMKSAISEAVKAKAISLPSPSDPVHWNWITNLAVA